MTEIYEVNSSKIVLVEPNPEVPKHLFVLDDDLRLFQLKDKNEGKAEVMSVIDLSLKHPDLDQKLSVMVE